MRPFNNSLKVIFLIGIASLLSQCTGTKGQDKQDEKGENWITLFDGSTTNEWRSKDSDSFPEHGWKVKDGQLIVLAKTENSPAGKDIITKNQFTSFELELDCKLTEGANSGIKYFVVNTFPGNEGQYLGCEYQLIDNERHPDALLGRDGNRKMAALYDLIPASGTKEPNPPGQWNKVGIIVNGNHVEHWLNDEKLVEYDRRSDHFRELVQISKYKNLKDFGEAPQGHILLQGHSDEVAFRSIRIRTL